ncbi:hypothetical protein [Streptomyces sp. NPDC056690]|uniref:hypothetical protein n=1 Tax=unclassified Streptomyces TaxID=2593676 RepID=UPI003627255A
MRVHSATPGPHTVALLVALQVLLEADNEAHLTARAGEELATEPERALAEAEPASGYRTMLRGGREQWEIARSAVTELRSLMAVAGREGLSARSAQTSVDLLRVSDDRNLGLSARVDFESRTGQYYGLLAQVVAPEGAPCTSLTRVAGTAGRAVQRLDLAWPGTSHLPGGCSALGGRASDRCVRRTHRPTSLPDRRRRSVIPLPSGPHWCRLRSGVHSCWVFGDP